MTLGTEISASSTTPCRRGLCNTASSCCSKATQFFEGGLRAALFPARTTARIAAMFPCMRRVGPPVKTSLAACIVLWSTGSLAQNKPAVLPPKPAEKSHQERFASPAEAARRNEERLTRRIQTHPADARAWMERGVVWMRSGDLAAAQAD